MSVLEIDFIDCFYLSTLGLGDLKAEDSTNLRYDVFSETLGQVCVHHTEDFVCSQSTIGCLICSEALRDDFHQLLGAARIGSSLFEAGDLAPVSLDAFRSEVLCWKHDSLSSLPSELRDEASTHLEKRPGLLATLMAQVDDEWSNELGVEVD